MNESDGARIRELVQNTIKTGRLPSGDYEIVKMAGDASSRRYYRLKGSENKFIVCLDKPNQEGSLSSFLDVHSILSQSGIEVPRVIDSDLSRGYLLEEDLGEVTLLSKLATLDKLDDEMIYYEKLIDVLKRINTIPVAQFPNSCINKYSFDQEKFDWESKFSIDNLLVKMMHFSPEDKRIPSIFSEFQKINKLLAAKPKVLCHRDFHSRNIMLKDNKFVIIDFQDARPGMALYDLVSLLEDCYYTINRENKDKLIASFGEWLVSKKYFNDMDEYHHYYSLMCIQRTFKALGSFGYIFVNKGDERYLKYIHSGIEKLKFHLYKTGYQELRKNLISILYEH